MELDDMKQAWQEMSAKLEGLQSECTSLRLDMRKNAAARPLRRTSAVIWFEAASNGLMLVLLGAFIAHQDAWRFIVPALILYPPSIALFANSVLQLCRLARLDFGDGVAAIQQKLERLYVLRLRMFQMTLLFACLLWVPLAIVLARGITGSDLYFMGSAWVTANVVFGIAVIPAGWWLARHFGAALGRSRWGRFLLDDVTGHGLAEARRRMAALAEFAADPE